MLTARRVPPPAPEAPRPAHGTLPRQTVRTAHGEVAHLRHGSGPPLLLLHGIPTSARLWEGLLEDLGAHHDCIAPDLLGLGRSVPAPGAELGSPGQADMLAGLLDALGIDQVALVCHDQGGAHGQQLLVRHPDRVSAVVFVDVVCFDNWLVPAIAMMEKLAASPRLTGVLGSTRLLERAMQAVWPLPQTLVRRRMPQALIDDWFAALREGGPALEHWRAYVRAQSPRWTAEAVPALEAWNKPAGVVWAANDLFLPPSWAVRLADALPTAPPPTLIPWAGHFLQAEVPASLARAILDLLPGPQAGTT